MFPGLVVILILKIAVILVTLILAASLAALARGRIRLHGQLNLLFLVLTLTAVFGLEILIRLVQPDLFDGLDPASRQALRVHLLFAVPTALILPIMYLTGRTRRSAAHRGLAIVFLLLWSGTFITGIFFLPHANLFE